MPRHLHLLHALRCFESAARHGSFTRAADELQVTQAAVSHQIRGLEDTLGLPLFDRLARSVMLTSAGEQLATEVCDAMARIDHAVDRLVLLRERPGLRLAVPPGFSSRWLVPRLAALRARQPGLELHLHHGPFLEEDRGAHADASVVFVDRPPTAPGAHRLFGTRLTPVCAPGMRLDSPAALRHVRLLHEEGFDDWARWMAAAGVPEQVRRGTRIDDLNALLSAAAAGEGVALGRRALIDEDLRAGRLVAPFDTEVACHHAYWLVAHRRDVAANPRFLALADFLQGEGAREETRPPLPKAA